MIITDVYFYVGVVYERMHTKLWISSVMPKYAVVYTQLHRLIYWVPLFSLVLILLGHLNQLRVQLLNLGVILGAAYILWLYYEAYNLEKSLIQILKILKILILTETIILSILAYINFFWILF